MIELVNISKSFGGSIALDAVNLTVRENSSVILIGPSGCGKSTLIRIITGLVKADSGEVKYNGDIITEDMLLNFRRKTGYVIQEGGLFPHLNAYDNISIMARECGKAFDVIESRIKYLCELTKFPFQLTGQFPSQLSGGERQRVSLMRALMMNPEILLLDEPLGALDPLIRFELQNDLKKIFDELNKTVIMVTHDLNEAAFFADEIVLMNMGKVVQIGAITELIDSPADKFTSKFIAAQRKNLL